MKRLTILSLLLSLIVMARAQQFVVTSITGQVELEENATPSMLRLRQVLTPQNTLILSYKAQVELLDVQNKRQYIIKTPGRARLAVLLKDEKSTVMQLTLKYFEYLMKRVRGNGELTSRRYSDPATVTREIAEHVKNYEEEFDDFARMADDEYEKFRQQASREYADFLRKAWNSFQAETAMEMPKEEVAPVIVPFKKDKTLPVRNKPLKVEDSILSWPIIPENPKPLVAIPEQKNASQEYVEFELYGTQMRVRFTEKECFELNSISSKNIADTWQKFATEDFNNTIIDCLRLRERHQLSDWAYLQMLDQLSKACFESSNEATLLEAFLFQQSGYKMRLGIANGRLYLLFASKHQIYRHRYFVIGQDDYYPFNCDEERMEICQASYPKERPLSLLITQSPVFSNKATKERELVSTEYPSVKTVVSINGNLMDFYNNYPSSMLNNNPMTRWASYADTPMEESVRQKLYTTFRRCLNGLSEKDAVERLLNWVQTAFKYEYDETVWGHDRVFFAEETLYYPYCDCEDRSILLSRLVRDLLGLKVILVYYPGHLAMAVGFTEDVAGDYIMQGGKRYVVCDPTYINAPVGMTMPDMNNQTARIILLE